MSTSTQTAKERFEFLPLAAINPSQTNPRKVFHEKPLDELAASIKAHGVLEPLLVREYPNGAEDSDAGPVAYFIVAGERRYRASAKAGLKEVPCIIKNLTDEQAFDIQIDENWQRKDLEPMDEARAIKFVQESGKLALEELAARLNKDIRFLHARLKLNDLTPDFQQALDDGLLPVTHAQLIARYGQDKQNVILKECFFGPIGSREMTLGELQSRISQYVERRLSDAPFKLDDARLRKDGLKCVDCKSRAGANPTLFEPVKPKEDRCLDATCFKNKSTAFVTIGRDDLTKKGKKKFGADYQAAIVWNYNQEYAKGFKDAIGPEGRAYKEVRDWNKKDCTGKEKAIELSYNGPKLVDICRDKDCPIHWKNSYSAPAPVQPPDERARRKEEIFDAKVREAVRVRVLLEAADEFAEDFQLTANQPDFIFALVERAQERLNDESIDYRLINPYLEKIGKKNPHIYSRQARIQWLKDNLDNSQLGAFLFLCVNGVRGVMGYDNHYKSQSEIMEIAELYGIDYQLYDAEQRLLECKNKKQRVGLEAYLEAVKAGGHVTIPRFWKADYVAPDTPAEIDSDDIEEFDDEDFEDADTDVFAEDDEKIDE